MDSARQKSFPITWEQLHRDAKTLALRLHAKEKFSSIVAIARGGLVPAAIIARELNIYMVDTICIVSYDSQDKINVETVLKSVDGDGSGVLIIDDIADTGSTAAIVRKILPKAHLATLYVKPKGKVFVDTFITEVSQETWILFPWDSEVQYTKPIAEITG